MTTKTTFVPCTIERGAFSGERVFTVKMSNGDSYTSLASYLHCLNENKVALSKSEPASNTAIPGYVVANVIKKDGSNFIVEVPDGQLVVVPLSHGSQRHAVPVGS